MELRSSTTNDPNLKIIQWEDYEQELVRLLSLSSALQQAQEKNLALRHRLETLSQVSSLIFSFLGIVNFLSWVSKLRCLFDSLIYLIPFLVAIFNF